VRRLAGAAAAALVLLAGCGGDQVGGRGDDEGSGDESGSPARTVERTRVEVIRETPDGEETVTRFDPQAVFRRASPGVVTIRAFVNEGGRNGLPGGGGVGSGFVVNDRGEIATNAHVVTQGEGSRIRRVDEVIVEFADRNQVPARIVGFDPNADVALLRLTETDGLTLRPLPLASSGDVRVGAPVAAIGSPFGEEQSLSVGVVSATDRAIQSLTGFDTLGAVQTDAAINQGNSGGPLLDVDGRVIGINAQIRTSSGGGEGVGYAIPVDQVRRSLDAIRERGEVAYPYLGVASTAVYPQLDERFDLGTDEGAFLQEIVEGGPADRAGLRAGGAEVRFHGRPFRPDGDVVVRLEDTPIRSENDLGLAVARFRPGQEVTVEYIRDGRREETRVRLAERPAQAERAP
jgi:S1-C subfamily serine protease